MNQRHLFVPAPGRKLKKLFKDYRKQRRSRHELPRSRFDWDKGAELVLKFAVFGFLVLLGLAFFVGGGILLFLMLD